MLCVRPRAVQAGLFPRLSRPPSPSSSLLPSQVLGTPCVWCGHMYSVSPKLVVRYRASLPPRIRVPVTQEKRSCPQCGAKVGPKRTNRIIPLFVNTLVAQDTGELETARKLLEGERRLRKQVLSSACLLPLSSGGGAMARGTRRAVVSVGDGGFVAPREGCSHTLGGDRAVVLGGVALSASGCGGRGGLLGAACRGRGQRCPRSSIVGCAAADCGWAWWRLRAIALSPPPSEALRFSSVVLLVHGHTMASSVDKDEDCSVSVWCGGVQHGLRPPSLLVWFLSAAHAWYCLS